MARQKISRYGIKKEKQNRQTAWQLTLSLCMLIGFMGTYLTWVPLTDGVVMLIVIVTIALLGCAIMSVFPKLNKWSGVVPIVFAAAAAIVTGPLSVATGMPGFLNYLIGWWNTRYDDGITYFNTSLISNSSIFAFSLVWLLLTAALIWWVVCQKALRLLAVLAFLLVLISCVIGRMAYLPWAFLITGFMSLWMDRMETALSGKRWLWTVCGGAILVVAAFFAGDQTLASVTALRTATADSINRLRFGEDSLPEGDLWRAGDMLLDESPTLNVTTEQIKNMYFRGFVGSDYADGKWTAVKKSVFGGENAGMMKWLSNHGFDANSEYADYILCNETPEYQQNQLTIENTGARRNYVYLPYSTADPKASGISSELDFGFRSNALFGSKKYTVSEWSGNTPSELLNLSDWIMDPSSDLQQQYVGAEEVYRSFVYSQYTTVDASFSDLIGELFWKDATTEDQIGVYAVTQRIRSVLETEASYVNSPVLISEDSDPLKNFLTGSQPGNAVFYASAAALAFRYVGIPARYAEGYYVTENQIITAGNKAVALTGKDSHAWVEVYMDGMGWVPVDVTPGYYYDTYTLMKMVQKPQGIKQTADLEDSEDMADGVQNDGESSTGNQADSKAAFVLKRLLFVGLHIVLLFVLVLVGLELMRLISMLRYMHRYNHAKEQDQPYLIWALIVHWMALFGIEVHLGWQIKEAENALRQQYQDIDAGEFQKVCAVLEKYAYSGEHLKPYELRSMTGFVDKLYLQYRKLPLVKQLRFRYKAFLKIQ